LIALTEFTFHWYIGIAPPFIAVAVKVTAEPGQNGFAEATMEMPAGRVALTTIVTEALVAGFPIVHGSDEVTSQVTISPFVGTYVNTALFPLIAFTALTFHWYTGIAPPFRAVAVKSTEVPAQTGFTDGETVTETGKTEFTTMTIIFEVAGLFEIQMTNDELQMTNT
jgi:hypothetical protein